MNEADQKPIFARCVICRAEFTEAQLEGHTSCPSCGTTSKPLDPANDLTIAVNWHELRILTMWAERHANLHKEQHPSMIEVVFMIAARIQDQHPDKTPLTFSGEIAGLKKAFPENDIQVMGNVTEGAPMPQKWEDTVDDNEQ